MNNNFFSGLIEMIARIISLILVLIFISIFLFARMDFRLGGLQNFVVLISGSIILYELLAFIFYEIFIFIEDKTSKKSLKANEKPNLNNTEELEKNI